MNLQMRRPNIGRAQLFPLYNATDLLSASSYEKECQALQKDSKAYWDAMRGESVSHAVV